MISSPHPSPHLWRLIVTIKSAVKLEKKPGVKSVVWVHFLAPLSHTGFKMQLYPRSHESSWGVGQVHDFSILSVLARSCPRAVTFLDLGITEFTSVKFTDAMLLAFSALPRLPVFVPHFLRSDPRVRQRISGRCDPAYPSGPHCFFQVVMKTH